VCRNKLEACKAKSSFGSKGRCQVSTELFYGSAKLVISSLYLFLSSLDKKSGSFTSGGRRRSIYALSLSRDCTKFSLVNHEWLST